LPLPFVRYQTIFRERERDLRGNKRGKTMKVKMKYMKRGGLYLVVEDKLKL
jgi:hypothetical protein